MNPPKKIGPRSSRLMSMGEDGVIRPLLEGRQSWVLILTPIGMGPSHPAIIGGYGSRDEAEAAGRSATRFPEGLTDEEHEAWKAARDAELLGRGGFESLPLRDLSMVSAGPRKWADFTVIPGAAAMAPQTEER